MRYEDNYSFVPFISFTENLYCRFYCRAKLAVLHCGEHVKEIINQIFENRRIPHKEFFIYAQVIEMIKRNRTKRQKQMK